MDEHRGLSAWLNSLSHVEAVRLAGLMREKVGIKEDSPVRVTGMRVDELERCLALDDCHSGEWWVAHCSCEVIDLGSGSGTSHARWQLNFTAGRGVTTPSKRSRGEVPMLVQLRSCVGESKWQALKQTVLANAGHPPPSRFTAKLDVHHVAYVASPQRWAGEGHPIPDQVGAGSSVGHLCDTAGCIRESHLVAHTFHVDNLARQRCPGCTVVVCGSVVIFEQVCGHGYVDGAPDFNVACTRVNVVYMPPSVLSRANQVLFEELQSLSQE